MATIYLQEFVRENKTVNDTGTVDYVVQLPFGTTAVTAIAAYRTITTTTLAGSIAANEYTITTPAVGHAGLTATITATVTLGTAIPGMGEFILDPKPAGADATEAFSTFTIAGNAEAAEASYNELTGALSVTGCTSFAAGATMVLTYTVTLDDATISVDDAGAGGDSTLSTLTGTVSGEGSIGAHLVPAIDAANYDCSIYSGSGNFALLKDDRIVLTLTNGISFAVVTTT